MSCQCLSTHPHLLDVCRLQWAPLALALALALPPPLPLALPPPLPLALPPPQNRRRPALDHSRCRRRCRGRVNSRRRSNCCRRR